MFERDGYPGTSMPAIADEAGVALKTVYVAFESKAGVVRALWAERLAPDEAEVPVLERRWYRDLCEEGDPERKLRLAARQSRGVKARSGALMEVIRNAAAGDPELARLWDDIEAKLLEVAGAIVRQLDGQGALAGRLDVESATDLLWTLNHPSVWQLLTVRRRWPAEAYEGWLGDALCEQLLAGRPGIG